MERQTSSLVLLSLRIFQNVYMVAKHKHEWVYFVFTAQLYMYISTQISTYRPFPKPLLSPFFVISWSHWEVFGNKIVPYNCDVITEITSSNCHMAPNHLNTSQCSHNIINKGDNNTFKKGLYTACLLLQNTM